LRFYPFYCYSSCSHLFFPFNGFNLSL